MTQAPLPSAQTGADYGRAAQTFVRRALAVHTMDNIAQELSATLREMLASVASHLVVVDSKGEVRAVGQPGVLPQADAALEQMVERLGPVRKGDLADGDDALRGVLDQLRGDVAVPLRYRGAVIGMIVAALRPGGGDEGELEFLKRMGHEASIAVANAHLHGDRQDKKTGKQVSLANALQDALCPEERPVRRGNILIRGLFRPALECGGDFWTWEDLGRGKVLVAVGDVTGKGVPAAMLAATSKGVACAMRVARGNELDPRDFLRTLNASIYRAARTQWLMTCFAVVVDTERGHIAYANAGHNFPYLRPAKGELQQLVLRGNTLGAAPDCEYVSDDRPLNPGDCLLLYSDGVIDATNPATGETFGEKRLRKLLQQGMKGQPLSADAIPGALLAETERHKTPGGRMIDDITIVIVSNEKGVG